MKNRNVKLIKCRNCKKMVSASARRCKYCGTLLKMPLIGTIIIIGLILFVFGLILLGILK